MKGRIVASSFYDVIHASGKRFSLFEMEGSKDSFSVLFSLSLLLSLSFFYLRIFQSLPTPQLLPDPRCSSPLLFLLIYLLCARSLFVRCLLIFSSGRCPQANGSVAPPHPPPPPHERQERRSRLRTKTMVRLKKEIEGREAKMEGLEGPWYDKGRGPFRPPSPPHIMLSPRGWPLGPSSGFTAPNTYGSSVC